MLRTTTVSEAYAPQTDVKQFDNHVEPKHSAQTVEANQSANSAGENE